RPARATRVGSGDLKVACSSSHPVPAAEADARRASDYAAAQEAGDQTVTVVAGVAGIVWDLVPRGKFHRPPSTLGKSRLRDCLLPFGGHGVVRQRAGCSPSS